MLYNKKDIDHAFTRLLADTHRRPDHGVRPNYQEDDCGPLWSYNPTGLDHTEAQFMIDGLYPEEKMKLVALPHENHYTLIGMRCDHDREGVYILRALYASPYQQRYYIIETPGIRYYNWLLRKFRGPKEEQAQQLAYQTLQQVYGAVSSSPTLSQAEVLIHVA